jgi:hypothetical protein
VRRQPSRFQGTYFVLSVAAVVAVIVVLLGLPTQRDVVPGVPANAIQLTVEDRPISRAVPTGFLGLSLEYTTLPAFAAAPTGDPTKLNPLFLRLVQSLNPGQQPVLRIGGDSSDWVYWPAPGVKRPRGIRYTLTPAWMQTTQALQKALHPRFIFGLNLEANDPRLMAAEATAMSSSIGASSIDAFEIGNEPEVYGAIGWYRNARGKMVRARRRGYHYPDYVREFSRFSQVVPPTTALAGPASGGPKWWAQTPNFLRSEPRARLITLHLYPLHRCYVPNQSPAKPSIPHLLALSSSTGLAAEIAPYAPDAHRSGARLRIDELNSVACGGLPGVSDRFASALWMLSTLLELAKTGVDGVNVHTSTETHYRPFSFRYTDSGTWTAEVAPEYYGMLAFAQTVPPGSRLLNVTGLGDQSLGAWGIRAPDGSTRVVVVNDSQTKGKTLALRLPGAAGTARFADMTRLSASSADAAGGVTLGGQQFAPATRTADLIGRRHTTRLTRTPNGFFIIRLPAASAAIVGG